MLRRSVTVPEKGYNNPVFKNILLTYKHFLNNCLSLNQSRIAAVSSNDIVTYSIVKYVI